VKEKLPLLNSDSKLTRIIGYVVYGFLFLIVLGALLPSEDTTTKTASDKTETSEAKTTDTEKVSNPEEEGWAVKVISDTGWSGSIMGDGNSRTVDGRRTKTFPVSGDPWMVSATFQKSGESGDLKVQILKDGEIKGESETSAAYGVVSVTS